MDWNVHLGLPLQPTLTFITYTFQFPPVCELQMNPQLLLALTSTTLSTYTQTKT